MSYIGNTNNTQAFTPAVDFFNGNGSTTAFTLSRPVASVAQVQAVISNVPQKPGDAFTVSGNTITFTSAPPSGTQNIYVYYTSPITQVIAPGQGTVGSDQLQSSINITTLSTTNGATVQGLTVGKGAGAVSTNTAVGASALAANTTGAQNTAVGAVALTTNTTSSGNTAIGWASLNVNTGAFNTAVGRSSLGSNESGANNTALGYQALVLNTTASNNTAVGYQAGYNNTSGAANTFIGGIAGITNTTGNNNTVIGYYAGNANSTGGQNAFLGAYSGALTTSGNNTFVGISAGENVTTGSKNTILGRYNGNQSGLDIRTANNNIVLSDGDGVPRIWVDVYGNNHFGNPGTNTTPAFNSGGTDPAHTIGNMSSYPNTASRLNIQERSGNWITFVNGSGTNYGVISVNGSGVTYGSNSDYRLKENVQPVANALAKVMALKPVSYEWIVDKSYAEGFLAHELQEVLPFAVKGTKDETYEVGQVLDADGNVISENTNRPEGEMLYGETWVKTGDEPKYQSIDTSHIIATLTAAIQELKAEFDAYKEAHP